MRRQTLLKKNSSLFIITAVLTVAAVVLFTTVRIAQAEAPTRILVIPFTMNAADDVGYLQRGISDMLVSRLEQGKDVIVITPKAQPDNLNELLLKEPADYIITGSVTILGSSVSTDAQVAKGASVDAPVLSFNQTGDQQSDVIAHINELAAAINARILNRHSGPLNKPDPTPPVAVLPLPAVNQSLTQPVSSSPLPFQPKNQPQSAARRAEGPLEPLQIPGIGFIKGQLNGMSTGDVDGNGVDDIVTITDNQVTVYRLDQGQWRKLAEYDSRGTFIGVDAADVNRNGKQEVFVTQFNQSSNRLISFVLEWDGERMQRIAAQLPWYFRRIDMFRHGRVLIGQRQGTGKPFATGIFIMQWTADAYTPGERLTLPQDMSIFGFAFGAVRSPDTPEVVKYDSDGYVQVLSSSGEEKWITTERYGGGSNFILVVDESQWDVENYVYLPPRIHLLDTDGDQINEILVINNQQGFTGSRALANQRYYSKGRLDWLKWHSTGVRSITRTLDMAKFIVDSALVDVDGDGNLEAVAAVVKKTRGVTTKGSSYIVSFKIDATH